MPTTDQLQFEMQRRVILFNSGTTMPDSSLLGYEGNPNLAGTSTPGRTLLNDSPQGTYYIQLSNGNLWYKKQKTPSNIWVNLSEISGNASGDFANYTNANFGSITFSSLSGISGSGIIYGTTGIFKEVYADNIVYDTGNQSIDGIKTFTTRPKVNSLNVLIEGDSIGEGTLPQSILYTTGNQQILASKTFSGDNVILNFISGATLLISGNPVLTGIIDTNWASQIELDNTGIALINRVDSLSGLFTGYTGSLDTAFATDVQLTQTGQSITNTIISLTGSLNSSGINIINHIYSLSGLSVLLTGNQNISGNKNFYSRPTVNGTGVILSGEIAALPNTIVYTTGNQIISGNKTFIDNLIISGTGIFNNIDLSNIGEFSFSGVTINLINSIVQSSGQIFISGNPVLTGIPDSSWATQNELDSTGIALVNRISSLSGSLNSSGINLTNTINSLSGAVVLLTGNQIVSGIKNFVSGVIISGPISGMYGTGDFLNALDVRGFASVGAELSSLTGMFTTGNFGLSGFSPGQFSAGGMLIGQNEGGAYIGRVGVRENSWQVLSGTEGVNWASRATSQSWYNVAMSSDGRIMAAASHLNIWISYDYGATWIQRFSANQSWWGIAMSSDGRIQTAVLNGGNIWTSYDYGVTWVSRATSQNWNQVAMSSDGRIQTAVVWGGGNIWTSYDYGATWVSRISSQDWLGIAMSSDGRIQTAVVLNGNIWTSYDYGVTWIQRTTTNQNWRNISMSSDGRIQTAVVWSGGNIWTSYDYGITWVSRATSQSWLDVAMSSDGRIQTAVVIGGNIWTSYDYGATWVSRATTQTWIGVAMSSDGRIQTAVPNFGNIWISYATTVTPNPIAVLGDIQASGQIYISGNPVLTGIPDGSWATQSELDSTGIALVNRIDSLSGSLNLSGIGLNNTINSLSGSAVLLTGNQNISGNKTFLQNINISGTGIFNAIDILTDTLSFSGVDIYLNSGSISLTNIPTVNGINLALSSDLGLLSGSLNSTGINIINVINSFSGLFTGYTGSLDNNFATDSQLTQTGLSISNTINSLSGSLNSSGINLTNAINSLSGSVVLLTGDQYISGIKDFNNQINVSGIKFDLLTGNNIPPAYQDGLMWYDDDAKALKFYNDITSPLTIGQEQIVRGANNLGFTLNKGQVVYITGAAAGGGDKFPGFQLSIASGEGGSARTLGIIAEDISNNNKGYAISFGRLEGIDTNAYNVGQTLYLSWTTSGGFTGVKPKAPNHMVRVGTVLRKGNAGNGVIFVTVQNGFELEELHDVNINSINTLNHGDTIRYNSNSGLWFNEPINTGIFKDQINDLSGASVLKYGDQEIFGTKYFNNSVYIHDLYVTGSEFIATVQNNFIESPYLLLNLTGGATDGGIFFVTGTGLTGINDYGPIIGFDHSDKFKFGIARRSDDLSTLNTIASITDITNYSGFVDNKYATIINLENTGTNLIQRINSLSGMVTNDYLTTSSAANTYATISNLGLTGSNLQNQINNLNTNTNVSLGNVVYLTGNQIISGNKTFLNNIDISGTGIFNALDLNNIDQLSLSGIDISITGSTVNVFGNILISGNPVLTGIPDANWASQAEINSLSGNLLSTGLGLLSRVNSLSGQVVFTTGNQTINGLKTFTSGIDIYSGTNAQSIRVFDSTGLNSGEFALFGWRDDQLIIGTQQSQSGLLRDIVLTGRNISINASGVLNIIDPVNISGNLNVTGNILLSGTNVLNYINSLSGSLNSSGIALTNTINSLSGSLNSSGIALVNRISSLSGVSVLVNGNQNIGGNKTFTGIITFSGQEVNLVDTSLNLSGVGDMTFSGTNINFINSPVYISGTDLRVDGNILLSGNPVLTGIPDGAWATQVELDNTGIAIINRINSLSGSLNLSGINLTNQIGSLSGSVVLLTGDQTISGIKTFKDNLIFGDSLFFYSSPSGYLTGSGYSGNYDEGYFLAGNKVTQNTLLLDEDNIGSGWSSIFSIPNFGLAPGRGGAISADGKYQTISTRKGSIYTSNNYGNSWRDTKVSGIFVSDGVSMSRDGKYQIAVETIDVTTNESGYVYISKDYGTNWTKTGYYSNWRSAKISHDGKYQIAVDAGDDINPGYLYLSKNYGESWEIKNPISNDWIYPEIYGLAGGALSSDGKYIIVTSDVENALSLSNDYGNTWRMVTGDLNINYSRAAISSNGKYQTVTSNNSGVFVSQDYGNSWKQISTISVLSLSMSQDGKYQVTNSQISKDYGNTWNSLPSLGFVRRIDISSNGKYLLGVKDDVILLSKTNEKIDGNLLANNLVYNTGNQSISGIKTFANHINVSGTGTFNGLNLDNINSLILSGMNINITGNSVLNIFNEVKISGNSVLTGIPDGSWASQNEINSLSGNVVFLTGNQTISGIKTFREAIIIDSISGDNLQLSGNSILLRSNDAYFPGGITLQPGSGIGSPYHAGIALAGKALSINSQRVQNYRVTLWKTGINNYNILTSDDLIDIYTDTNIRNNLNVVGTGSFNGLNLENINTLTLSGMNINITGNSVLNIFNPVRISGNDVLTGVTQDSRTVLTTTNQSIDGVKTFAGTGVFNTLSITNKKLTSYAYHTSNFSLGDNYINLINSANSITGTLPEVISGINYYVKNLNTGLLLITGSNSRVIDGLPNVNLYKNEGLELMGVNNIGYTGWITIGITQGVS